MDCGQTLVSYTLVGPIWVVVRVVDCGQTLVSYTIVGAPLADCGCGLRTDLGELHFSHAHGRLRGVVDCGQTLVSYTGRSLYPTDTRVVDCGQTLVSYTRKRESPTRDTVVDCGQTLVSYTVPGTTRRNRGGFALQIDYKSSIWRGAGSGGLRFFP